MLAADERLAVVFHRNGSPRPSEVDEQVGHGRAVRQRDRRTVRGDGEAQDFAAVKALAAAFFCAL